MYYLLTGHVPFPDGTVVEKAIRRLNGEPRPVEELRPDLPAGLVGVVRRMMGRNPQDRFRSMAEAADALSGLVAPAAVGDTAETPALTDLSYRPYPPQ